MWKFKDTFVTNHDKKLWGDSENILNWMIRETEHFFFLVVEVKQWLMEIYNINNKLLIQMPYIKKEIINYQSFQNKKLGT